MLKGKYVRTPEILEKQRIAQIGKISSLKGSKLSEVHKQQISLKLKGHKDSEQTREKKRKMRVGKKWSIEIRRKISNSHRNRKEKHWNWQGGVEKIDLRNTLEYRLWRESIFRRDDFTCIWCGKSGGTLNADHIKPFAVYPELRFAIDNGRTLCVSCHRSTETYGGGSRRNKKLK